MSHLHLNTETNVLGLMLITGFGQTASSQEVREFMLRGKDIAKKHIRIFAEKFTEKAREVTSLPVIHAWRRKLLNLPRGITYIDLSD